LRKSQELAWQVWTRKTHKNEGLMMHGKAIYASKLQACNICRENPQGA